jgi:hypothetical protein
MLPIAIRVTFFVVSWLSVIFLPNKKKLFVKYLPVTLFSLLTVMCEIFYFTTHKLWKVKGGQKNMTHTAYLLLFGPYLVMNIWVFYLSKGKFLLYALINIVADLIYAFPVIAIFNKLDVFKIKVICINFFLLILSDAFLNFGFQKVFEKIYSPSKVNKFSNS